MRNPTEKQLKLIENMKLLLDIKFVGTTIAEASKFISDNMERYKEAQEFVFDMTYYDDVY